MDWDAIKVINLNVEFPPRRPAVIDVVITPWAFYSHGKMVGEVPLAVGCLVGVHVTHFGVAWAEEKHPDIWTNENAMLIGVILKIGTAKALARSAHRGGVCLSPPFPLSV